MAASAVTISWTGDGLRFEAAHISHNTFRIDGDGVTSHSPVQVLLLSLAGCTAADVIAIITKMRVPISGLEVSIEADRNPEPPRYLTAVTIQYRTRGVAAQDREKVERAIELSHEKYCSVLHSLRKDLKLGSELVIG